MNKEEAMAILEAFLEDNDRNNMLLQRTIRDIDEGVSFYSLPWVSAWIWPSRLLNACSAVKAWGRPPSA